jgi:hypothetical protein
MFIIIISVLYSNKITVEVCFDFQVVYDVSLQRDLWLDLIFSRNFDSAMLWPIRNTLKAILSCLDVLISLFLH